MVQYASYPPYPPPPYYPRLHCDTVGMVAGSGAVPGRAVGGGGGGVVGRGRAAGAGRQWPFRKAGAGRDRRTGGRARVLDQFSKAGPPVPTVEARLPPSAERHSGVIRRPRHPACSDPS
jgi:hypothetical protein